MTPLIPFLIVAFARTRIQRRKLQRCNLQTVILTLQRSLCAREARLAEIEAVRRLHISTTNSPSSNDPERSGRTVTRWNHP